MQTTRANGIELCYETCGSPDDPTLLLIMGLGAQLIAWPDAFCEAISSRGFFVVRYDNRDVGLSTKFEASATRSAAETMTGTVQADYTLDDMADDAAALLDALGRSPAHVVGASMGGMIAQTLALRHPDKVLTLTSIMSHPGGTDAVPPTEEALAVLLAKRPENRDEVVEMAVRARRVIGGKGFPFDEAKVREDAGRAYDRSYYPSGFLRQIAAIMASPGRAQALGSLRVPAVVIHGTDDTLVPAENGRRTANAIPGAELLEIDGMGHDLPEGAWPRIVDAIVALTRKATVPADR